MSEISGRRIQYLMVIAIVALVLIGVLAASRPLRIQSNASVTTRTIQVNGVGTISTAADETILKLAVETRSATATQATNDNAVTMTRVIQALGSIGVGSNSVATLSYSLSPIYDNARDTNSPPKIVGYSARNAIQITIVNVNSTGRVLDTAVAAGANEVDGVTFTLTSQTFSSLQKQALQLAIKDASGQAQVMASNLGMRIVGPLTVTTGYYYPPSVERLSTSALTPIQSGTLQVSATVQVTYEVTS